MKQKLTFRTIGLALCCLIGLVGCEQNVDLNHIDARVAASMGIALPIGEMSASLGDFVKAGTIPNIYVREDGVYYYHDTVHIPTKTFHFLNLDRFNVHYNAEYPLYNTLHAITHGLDRLVGDGTTSLTLDCPFAITLDGINTDIQQERIDSVIFDSLTLRLALTPNHFDLRTNELNQLYMVLGDEIQCQEGKRIHFDLSHYAWSDSLSVVLHNVHLCLMKDPSNPNGGSKNTLSLCLGMKITLQTGHEIAIQSNSALQMGMALYIHHFQAIWGYFTPSNEMSEIDAISLDSVLGEEAAKQLKSLNIHFAEPRLGMVVDHHVAAPLICKIHYLYAYHKDLQQRTYATWNGNTYANLSLDPVLDPIHSALTDSVTNSVFFSSDEREGHIDQLFDHCPDSIGYNFEIMLDQNQRTRYPQHRMVSNTSVRSDAILTVPFVFKENTSLNYIFTLDSINISALSLDSLIPAVKKLDTLRQSDLRLFLTISNGIPFAIKAKVSFLDANNQEVNLHPLVGDSLYIAAPTNIKNHIVMEPKETDVIVSLTRDQWRTFSQVKKIRLDAFLGDNPATVQLDTDAQLKLRLGLSAKTDVVYNFNNIFDGKEGEK